MFSYWILELKGDSCVGSTLNLLLFKLTNLKYKKNAFFCIIWKSAVVLRKSEDYMHRFLFHFSLMFGLNIS